MELKSNIAFTNKLKFDLKIYFFKQEIVFIA